MQLAQIPAKFPIPFADQAGGAYIRNIPKNSQIGINNGWASLADGFPPLNATPTGAGGVPPFIQDFNGLFKAVTSWNRWHQAGGPVTYDAAFQADVGGYPLGAVVQSATTPGRYWRSTADNNLNNPDTGGANWVDFFAPVFVSPVFTSGVTILSGSLTISASGLISAGAVTANSTLSVAGVATFSSVVNANGGLGVSAGLAVYSGTTQWPNGTRITAAGVFQSNQNVELGAPSSGIGTGSQLLTVNNPNGTAAAFQNTLNIPNAPATFFRSDRTDGSFAQFLYGTSLVGQISTDGGSVYYTSFSDYRLKTNNEDLSGAVERLLQLKPIRFSWKNPDVKHRRVDGFLAHEVAEVVPEAVQGEKDAVAEVGDLYYPAGHTLSEGVDLISEGDLDPDEEWVKTGERAGPEVPGEELDDGGAPIMLPGPPIPVGTVKLKADRIITSDVQKPAKDDLGPGIRWRKTKDIEVHQTLDQAKLIPLLTAALQEALARIEALEAAQAST